MSPNFIILTAVTLAVTGAVRDQSTGALEAGGYTVVAGVVGANAAGSCSANRSIVETTIDNCRGQIQCVSRMEGV